MLVYQIYGAWRREWGEIRKLAAIIVIWTHRVCLINWPLLSYTLRLNSIMLDLNQRNNICTLPVHKITRRDSIVFPHSGKVKTVRSILNLLPGEFVVVGPQITTNAACRWSFCEVTYRSNVNQIAPTVAVHIVCTHRKILRWKKMFFWIFAKRRYSPNSRLDRKFCYDLISNINIISLKFRKTIY